MCLAFINQIPKKVCRVFSLSKKKGKFEREEEEKNVKNDGKIMLENQCCYLIHTREIQLEL